MYRFYQLSVVANKLRERLGDNSSIEDIIQSTYKTTLFVLESSLGSDHNSVLQAKKELNIQ